MSETFRSLMPLNWDALVGEALRRRKVERLTQREHAALANVSIPTIAAFERGETTLTLAKAFDILRVVGLVAEAGEGGAQEAFVRAAYERWRTLTSKLDPNSPGRFPHGWYRFDYWLEGDIQILELDQFQRQIEKAVGRGPSWPLFHAPLAPEAAPREVEETIECWLPPVRPWAGIVLNDAAHCDFWRAAPEGRLLVMRGYSEDGQATFPPAAILDTALPIWFIGEAMLHSARLAALLRKNETSGITVHFRATYSGLTGRVLRPWTKPLGSLMIEGQAARSDEAVLEISVAASQIEDDLAACVFPLITSLYERFGVAGLSPIRVEDEIRLMLGQGNRASR